MCVCKSVCICGDESRGGGRVKAKKSDKVRYGETETKREKHV